MARELIPIFPLEHVVLFPRVATPLHLFEPRYRQMAEEVLAGERRIAMATVRPEFAGDLSGDPEVYPIGCAGVITQAEQLPDGRYNIVLMGRQRVRIVREPERPARQLYRTAEVEHLEDALDPADSGRIAALRERVLALVAELVRDGDPAGAVSADRFEGVDDAVLVNSLSNALPLATAEKQGLLEANGIAERFERLAGMLAFLRAERDAAKPPNSGTLH